MISKVLWFTVFAHRVHNVAFSRSRKDFVESHLISLRQCHHIPYVPWISFHKPSTITVSLSPGGQCYSKHVQLVVFKCNKTQDQCHLAPVWQSSQVYSHLLRGRMQSKRLLSLVFDGGVPHPARREEGRRWALPVTNVFFPLTPPFFSHMVALTWTVSWAFSIRRKYPVIR